MDWEPGSITWYVDGFLWAHFAVSIKQPEYLIADLAVDGKLPPNSAVRFPQSLVIRSIEVWQHPSRVGARTVSYTHLDVYKRQVPRWCRRDRASEERCSES